jgi:hypothetical protein
MSGPLSGRRRCPDVVVRTARSLPDAGCSDCSEIAARQATLAVYSSTMARLIMYVQLKTGYDTDRGPSWIAWVRFSKTWNTAYIHGRTLRRGSTGSWRPDRSTVRWRDDSANNAA